MLLVHALNSLVDSTLDQWKSNLLARNFILRMMTTSDPEVEKQNFLLLKKQSTLAFSM